jgi:hypothetical protein
MENPKFYIIDSGEKVLGITEQIESYMQKKGYHYVSYLTSQDHYLAVEEVDEDEFLNHFSKYKENANT